MGIICCHVFAFGSFHGAVFYLRGIFFSSFMASAELVISFASFFMFTVSSSVHYKIYYRCTKYNEAFFYASLMKARWVAAWHVLISLSINSATPSLSLSDMCEFCYRETFLFLALSLFVVWSWSILIGEGPAAARACN